MFQPLAPFDKGGCRASDWGIIAYFIIKRNPTVTTKVVPPPLNLKEAVGGAPRVSGCRASDWGMGDR